MFSVAVDSSHSHTHRTHIKHTPWLWIVCYGSGSPTWRQPLRKPSQKCFKHLFRWFSSSGISLLLSFLHYRLVTEWKCWPSDVPVSNAAKLWSKYCVESVTLSNTTPLFLRLGAGRNLYVPSSAQQSLTGRSLPAAAQYDRRIRRAWADHNCAFKGCVIPKGHCSCWII